MSSAEPEAVHPSRWILAIYALAVAACVGFYSYMQVTHFSTACGEPDTAGYLILAERMASGGPLGKVVGDPCLCQSHVWVENSAGEVFAKYPPGYPLIMAIFMKLFGWQGAFAVSPVLGGVALLGAWRLFRQWLSRGASALALAILAGNPVLLFYCGYPLSHAAELACITWGMHFLLRWMREPRPALALASGLILGYAVLVRPTSLLLCLAVGAAMAGLLAARQPGLRRALAWMAGSYAVFPLLYCLYDVICFGSPFFTGYYLSGEQNAFSLEGLQQHWLLPLRGLESELLPGVFALGLAGIFAFGSAAEQGVRLLWFMPFWLAYGAYYWAAPQLNLAYYRFFICTMPLFAGTAFALIEKLPACRFYRYVAMVAMTALLLWQRSGEVGRLLERNKPGAMSMQQDAASRAAAANLRPGAAIFSAMPVAQYFGGCDRFDVYNLDVFDQGYVSREFIKPYALAARRQESRTGYFKNYYSNHPKQEDLAREKRERVRDFLARNREVAFIIPEGLLGREQSTLGNAGKLELKASWDAQGRWGLYLVAKPNK